MKTMDYINAQIEWFREDYFAERREMNDALETLEAVYGTHIQQQRTPKETILECIQELGKEKTEIIIATLVNYHGWDGRISRRAKEWAAAVPMAYDEKAAGKLGLYTCRIHMSHLDQLAREMAKTPA